MFQQHIQTHLQRQGDTICSTICEQSSATKSRTQVAKIDRSHEKCRVHCKRRQIAYNVDSGLARTLYSSKSLSKPRMREQDTHTANNLVMTTTAVIPASYLVTTYYARERRDGTWHALEGRNELIRNEDSTTHMREAAHEIRKYHCIWNSRICLRRREMMTLMIVYNILRSGDRSPFAALIFDVALTSTPVTSKHQPWDINTLTQLTGFHRSRFHQLSFRHCGLVISRTPHSMYHPPFLRLQRGCSFPALVQAD